MRSYYYLLYGAALSVALLLLLGPQVFTTGTAVGICAVGSLTYDGTKKQYGAPGEPTPVALQLYTTLTELQDGKSEDDRSWVAHVC